MTKTVDALTVTTSAASGDEIMIWRVSNGDTRKITKANFMGGVITGGGTLATGGFTLTVSGTSTINGSLVGNMTGSGTVATAGFTLTVPATGTAGLLGTVQTYTAAKTFSAAVTISALLTASGGVRSGSVTLATNTATSITPPATTGMMLVFTNGSGKQTVCGILTYTTTPGVNLLVGGSAFVVTTGVLSGTTGTASKVNVSPAADGKIYIENQGATTSTIVYKFIV